MRRLILLIFSLVVLLAACSDSSKDEANSLAPIPTRAVLKVPSEYLTIQDAVDNSEDGDTILVAAGVYSGQGNCDIELLRRQVYIFSESGPATTVIECGGTAAEPHLGFQITGQSDASVIDGFTIRDGYAAQGAAISCQTSSLIIRNCIFYNNRATTSGGAIRCKGTSPKIINCTFIGNAAPVGGTLQVMAGASPTLERCIVAFSSDGGAVYSSGNTSIPRFSCCLVYGNVGGDWEGLIADQLNQRGNLHEDPVICGPETADFRLSDGSPCLPSGNSCGVLIGALGAGCD